MPRTSISGSSRVLPGWTAAWSCPMPPMALPAARPTWARWSWVKIRRTTGRANSAGGSSSEHQPQAQLDVPRGPDRGRDHARRRAPDGRVRQIELRMVEGVEELAADLDPVAFRNLLLLENRAIEVGAAGSPKNIAAAVAVRVLPR